MQKLDQGTKQVSKFDYVQLQSQDILIKPYKIKLDVVSLLKTTDRQKASYDKLKESLGKDIEDNVSMDPNNLPRRLQVKSGNYKKELIQEDKLYIARNQRFKLKNVETYRDYDEQKEHIIIDFPISRLDLVDYILKTKTKKLKYLSTDLSIDQYLVGEVSKWIGRLDAFYAQANLYR